MKYIIGRLREPSTYAGIAALLAAFGMNIPIEHFQAVSSSVIAIAGLLAVFMKEQS
jgi:hypothetical protein